MTDPTQRNRLEDAASPYLRGHADNPVHWQPWDDTALTAAVEQDVPIFLSIGYEACHWCHVMAEESFDDAEVASVLNEKYIPIKVDREERPDIDSLYMTACQLTRGRGGWPLSVWLTPHQDPFHVATYLPKEPTRGQPGFLALIEEIAGSWADPEERQELEDRATQLATAITDDVESVPDTRAPPSSTILEEATGAVIRSADRSHGGFGSAPKFPQPMRIRLLYRGARAGVHDEAASVADDALEAMATGGLYDHLGGGFHRYCTDADWTVPHYEKMLYDNAMLPLAYLDGYRYTGSTIYKSIVCETLDFVAEVFGASEGGFYSTLAARAGDVEGAYYTWTPDELETAMQAGDIDDIPMAMRLAKQRWGITDAGNTEDGRTVLTINESIDSLATEHDRTTDAVETLLNHAQAAMVSHRETRERPARDEKILAGWNGLAITAFAEAGLAIDEGYTDTAVDALEFIRENCWTEDQLYRRYHHGDRGINGYLEDYAFLAHGALTCYEATGTHHHLDFALDLGDAILEKFWDATNETLYFTETGGEQLLARPQELQDRSTPASTGIASHVLAALDHFTTNDRFGDVASTVLDTHGSSLNQAPLQHLSLILAAETITTGHLEITTVGTTPTDWLSLIGTTYLPDRLRCHRPATTATLRDWLTELDLPEAPPVWASRNQTDGTPTAYVCRQACSPPIHDVDTLTEYLNEYTPTQST